MPASEPAALEISEYENAGHHGHPLSQRHVLKRMYGYGRNACSYFKPSKAPLRWNKPQCSKQVRFQEEDFR